MSFSWCILTVSCYFLTPVSVIPFNNPVIRSLFFFSAISRSAAKVASAAMHLATYPRRRITLKMPTNYAEHL